MSSVAQASITRLSLTFHSLGELEQLRGSACPELIYTLHGPGNYIVAEPLQRPPA